MVLIEGGTLMQIETNQQTKSIEISDFYMSKHEITQREWRDIMGNNPSAFKGELLPVEMVNWYQCVDYCNRRSVQEGLTPFYIIQQEVRDTANVNDMDSLKWTVQIRPEANGYRLPTEAEWEYAARGGSRSKGYLYSGSNMLEEVGWYWQNSGNEPLTGDWSWAMIEKNEGRTHPVGTKSANELGLYDMSGNVREWCSDWYRDEELPIGIFRVQRGGGWMGSALRCQTDVRHHFEPLGVGPDQGFRVCRSAL